MSSTLEFVNEQKQKEEDRKRDLEQFETILKNLKNHEGPEYVTIENLDLQGVHIPALLKSFGCCNELRRVHFRNVNLSYSCFGTIRLTGVFFENVSLVGASFNSSTLYTAYFMDVDLSHAEFKHATLENVRFENVKLLHSSFLYANMTCVHSSDRNFLGLRRGKCLNKKIIGWKKCSTGTVTGRVLVKLEIPKGAVVFSINDNKCRTNMVKVLDIVSMDGKKHFKKAYSMYTSLFVYKVGETIIEPDFDCRYNIECSSGIHFFRTKREAKNY